MLGNRIEYRDGLTLEMDVPRTLALHRAHEAGYFDDCKSPQEVIARADGLLGVQTSGWPDTSVNGLLILVQPQDTFWKSFAAFGPE